VPDRTLEIHLFGASTVCGNALRNIVRRDYKSSTIWSYSRRQLEGDTSFCQVDLESPFSFFFNELSSRPGILISFAPIWLLAPFVELLVTNYPERIRGLTGIIACSSSSAITKRFASNHYDRSLVARLRTAEDLLIATCQSIHIPCQVIQPTLIYGQAGDYTDNNLSRVLSVMRKLPCILLPSKTGLRQPIHASQVGKVALHYALMMNSGKYSETYERVAVGGDTTLTYAEMLSKLQKAQPANDPARRCQIKSIPNRLFFALSSPLLLSSPKTFEAVLRIGADLSGFIPAHKLLSCDSQPFPILPLNK